MTFKPSFFIQRINSSQEASGQFLSFTDKDGCQNLRGCYCKVWQNMPTFTRMAPVLVKNVFSYTFDAGFLSVLSCVIMKHG